MKWLRNMKDKKGSYIVEAAIIIPIFVLAVVLLVSIIPVISNCENILYSCCDELRFEDARSGLVNDNGVLPVSLSARVYSENRDVSSFRITSYRYKYSDGGIDDLISVSFKVVFSKKNPLGLFSSITFDGKVVSRAFTGTTNEDKEAGLEDFENNDDKLVYVFPDWGEKYHKEGCQHLESHCRLTVLSQLIMKHYHACPNCSAKDACIGTQVFVFPEEGEAYHTGECKSVKKYYVEIEKDKAIEEGYGQCTVCRP